MSTTSGRAIPAGTPDERELYLRWLGFLRGAVLTKINQDLRWVLLYLINETARHAGHADATRELLDGMTGV